MREQLIRYVDLLFAGVPDAVDVKQEILQNTLDRYDDLVAQGKSPEAAYRLAISGIGDINEILGGETIQESEPVLDPARRFKPEYLDVPAWKKVLRAIAVCLYIISIIPLIVLSEIGMEIIGLCGTIAIAAVATALIIIAAGSGKQKKDENEILTPRQELRKSIKNAVSAVCLCVYLFVSFLSQAWHITWIIFPLSAAVRGLIFACMDLKEVYDNED